MGEVVRTGKDCFGATRRLRTALLTSSALALAWTLPAMPSRAQDATWLTSPDTNDYGTGSNWSTNTVPTGTAAFGTSDTTSLSISSASVSGWTFNAGASDYTFDVGSQLTFLGAGITVNGGSVTINFNSVATNGLFYGSSTLGNATINNNNGNLQFFDNSTAGNATLNNNGAGQIDFLTSGPVTAGSIAGDGVYDLGGNQLTVGSNNLSTVVSGNIVNGSLVKTGTGTLTLAGYHVLTGDLTINRGTVQVGYSGSPYNFTEVISGAVTVGASGIFGVVNSDLVGVTTVSNSGTMTFRNDPGYSSSASSANITNSGALSFYNDGTAENATIANTAAGTVDFYDRSTAGNATINNSSGSFTFHNSSTAGTANITNDIAGTVYFRDASSAASATIANNSNATLAFYDTSTAGNATINNYGLTRFYDTSTAGNATINNYGGMTWFSDASTAGSATITNSTTGQVVFTNSSTAANATIANGFIGFYSSSTAGSATITVDNASGIAFHAASNAGSATITNNSGGSTYFYETTTAGSATITNNSGGSTYFYDTSTAGSATITNNGSIDFNQTSTAGSAGITNNGALSFSGSSTAGGAAINNAYNISFNGTSTAGNAVIINNGGGTTAFQDTSTAGNAQLINNDPSAVFDFSGSSGPNGDHKLSAGSIAGNGTFDLGANALTVGGNNLSTIVSGVIADGGNSGGTGGSLVKTGTGTLTLSGTNLYSGGTTFAGGTVSVSSDANLGDVVGGLTFTGGTLQITGTAFNATARAIVVGAGGGTFDIADAANAFTVTQGLTGTGGLTKSGAGTLTLQSANTYTGVTTVSAGTLIIQDSIASSVVTNNATLVYDSNSTAGNASITNNSQLTFGDTATAGSAIIINNNQLTFYGHTTAGNAVITNSGNVLFDGDSTPGNAQLINAASGAVINFFTPGLNSDGRISAGSLAGNGVFDLNGIELTVGGNNLSTAVTGVLTGDGIVTGTSLIKVGTGTLTLAGVNTYTGATTVDGGALVVNGSIAASSGVTVNNGGTLGGGGTVGTTTVNAGGTLAAGNGTANSSLHVAGSLALQSGAIYIVQINPTTSSFANVTGTATLGGSTLEAVYANGSYVAKQYAVLTAGSVSGTFGSVVETNLPSNFHSALSYDGTHAYLNLILNFVAPPGSGLSGNQQKVGNAIINSFNANGGISLVYSGLTAAGLTQASGETATGGQQTAFNAMTQFMGSMTDVFAAGRGGTASGAMGFADEGNASAYAPAARSQATRDAYAMFTKAPLAQGYDPRWSVWASGFGGSQTTDGNSVAGSNTSTSRIYGVAAGADYRFAPDTIAGFAMAGGGTNFSVTGGGSGHSDLFQIGGFVRHAIGSTYLSGALAYGWQDVTTNRTVIADQLQARFNANTFSGRFEAGNRVVTSWLGGLGLTPYAAVQVTAIALPAYAESALSGSSAFALSYSGKTVTDTRSELGLRTDKSFAVNDAILTLRGRAAWAHDFNTDRAASATFLALPGASFVVNGAAPARDVALTTASAEMSFISGISLAATFEGEFSDVTRSYAGKGTVRYQW